ncbi:MAG: S-methyl-5-thioribose-1-phosphate isomerase, partial [Planctomycetes bacterium]|nr:S-methyl-5-thioribose-1-phosphate isomerase [Planctomycetota bacterium]
MPVPTIEWEGDLNGRAKLVDQTLLPNEFKFIYCDTPEQMWEAIKQLKVRGAPAIGIAGAMGLVLGIQKSRATNFQDFSAELKKVSTYLASSRPTAVNLFWALERMERVAQANRLESISALKRILLTEARKILDEDRQVCRKIGLNGAALLKDGDTLLTHCNAGGLATGDYGTALAVIFAAKEEGKRIHVYADETRPLLQGARLTAWELMHAGVDVTLICDNMAATVMHQGRIDAVIVGADRIAANGDTANKIGTYGVAVLAKEHKVPFYVAAPASTFDLRIQSGVEIPIEERKPEEITDGFGKRTAPHGIKVYNPAFDVTPARYISAIITERGVI